MRNEMRHSARGAALLLLILPLFIGAPHARADGDNWDPDKVTELANRLAGEVKAMRAATRKEPQIIAASTTTKQRATATYLETLKKLERTTGKLAPPALRRGNPRADPGLRPPDRRPASRCKGAGQQTPIHRLDPQVHRTDRFAGRRTPLLLHGKA